MQSHTGADPRPPVAPQLAVPVSADGGLVYLVDDDPAILRSVGDMLQRAGFRVAAFPSAVHFLAAGVALVPSCVILDFNMPEVSGLDAIRELRSQCWDVPVLFITGHASVSSAVEAMKCGAMDFLTKPLDADMLVSRVTLAVERSKPALAAYADYLAKRRLFDRLSPREQEVCRLMGSGYSSKQIAAELGTTDRTVKHQRAHVMRKLEAASVADVVRTLDTIRMSLP